MQKLKYERPFLKKLNANTMNKFGSASGSQPLKQIDGISVRSLTEQFGSPLFVISERQIRRNFRSALRAFNTSYPKVQFAWSYKTNYLNAVCRIFHQEGSWAEVVSGFEYRKALGNGITGSQIIFNGPGKKKEDLVLAIENDSLIHIDNFDELYAIINLAERLLRKPRVAIRVNLDAGIYPLWDRFGFNYENGEAWNALEKIVSSGKMQLVGLHCHIGTFVMQVSAYTKATEKLCKLALRLKNEFKVTVEYLDLGGGFASSNTLKGSFLHGADVVPSYDDYAAAIATPLLNCGFSHDELPTLILETGRALIDEAAWLIGMVTANKRLTDGRRATILDFGVNTLFTSFWYDHQVSPAVDTPPHSEPTVLYGPLCMNIDMIRESISLPPLNPGDQVVVHRVGAYNMTQWMQFITTRPAVVLIDENHEPHLVRMAETLDYIEQMETLPAYLEQRQFTP